MIKLAAFDVDGTLRDRDYLPASTKQALHKLKEHGVQLALCTGRSEYEMASLYKELEIDWAITCNGSHIGHRGTTVFGSAFDPETVKRWLREADRAGHAALLYGSELMYTNQENAPWFLQAQKEIGFMEPVLLPSLEKVPAIYQCILFCTEQEESAYTSGEHEPLYVHRWRDWAVDLNPSGMNKAVGLRRLLDHLGIPIEQAAAFGDGINDMEMMEAAGLGIAMGNAADELKSKARYVTRSLHEDGIAYAVDQWILR